MRRKLNISADNPDARFNRKIKIKREKKVSRETGAHRSHFIYIKRRSLPNIVSQYDWESKEVVKLLSLKLKFLWRILDRNVFCFEQCITNGC